MTNNRKFIITSLSLTIAIALRVQAFGLYTSFLISLQFIEKLQKTVFRKPFQHCRATFCSEWSKMLQNQSHSKTFNVVKIRQSQAAEYSEDSRFSSSEYYLLVRLEIVSPKVLSRRCVFVQNPLLRR